MRRWLQQRLDALYARGSAPRPALVPGAFFCVALRHDLDALDGELIADVAGREAALGVRSTCFVLEAQLRRFPAAIRALRDGGWEIALHSEARPRAFVTFTRHTPKYGTLVTQALYARTLRRQAREFARRGIPVSGHAPHGINCCLDVNNEDTWDIIERASLRADFRWMAGYRAIFDLRGTDFPPPVPPYRYTAGDGTALVVYPTAWDDRYFFPSWQDRLLGWKPKTEADARGSLARQLDACEALGVPMVVSLHPWWWFSDSFARRTGQPVYTFDLEAWLVERCRALGIPVLTLAALHARLTGDAG